MIRSYPIAIGKFKINGKIIHADTHAQAVRKYRNAYRLGVIIMAVSVLAVATLSGVTLLSR